MSLAALSTSSRCRSADCLILWTERKVGTSSSCGMNCRLCRAYTRDKKACPGCRADDRLRPKTRVMCKIRDCKIISLGKVKYCFSCDSFPCTNLNHLDKRYRTKYGMSMIDNLEYIERHGVRDFIRNEKKRWACPTCGHLICVHKPQCPSCGCKWIRKCRAGD